MPWRYDPNENEEEKRAREFRESYILLEQFRDEADANSYCNRISSTLEPIVRSRYSSRPGGGPSTLWYYVYIRRPRFD